MGVGRGGIRPDPILRTEGTFRRLAGSAGTVAIAVATAGAATTGMLGYLERIPTHVWTRDYTRIPHFLGYSLSHLPLSKGVKQPGYGVSSIEPVAAVAAEPSRPANKYLPSPSTPMEGGFRARHLSTPIGRTAPHVLLFFLSVLDEV